MKLWKITQDVNDDYDTYDSAIVAAETEEEARKIHPSKYVPEGWPENNQNQFSSWTNSWIQVSATYIGEASPSTPAGVILASFNAG